MSDKRQLIQALQAERDRYAALLDPAALFEFVKHGDEHHQAWLREAFEAYVAGNPKPEPRGLGRHGAKIAALEAENSSYAALLEELENILQVSRYSTEMLMSNPPQNAVASHCLSVIARAKELRK